MWLVTRTDTGAAQGFRFTQDAEDYCDWLENQHVPFTVKNLVETLPPELDAVVAPG